MQAKSALSLSPKSVIHLCLDGRYAKYSKLRCINLTDLQNASTGYEEFSVVFLFSFITLHAQDLASSDTFTGLTRQIIKAGWDNNTSNCQQDSSLAEMATEEVQVTAYDQTHSL